MIAIKEKIITGIFTQKDIEHLSNHQIEYLKLNYQTCHQILIDTKTNHIWRYAKRKSILDIDNDYNFYLVKVDNPSISLHIFNDETFITGEWTLLSSEEINMLFKLTQQLIAWVKTDLHTEIKEGLK